MSRIGNNPISIPQGVEVNVNENIVTVKGKLGELSQEISEAVNLKIEDGTLTLERASDSKPHKAKHGLYRALINNMVEGVSKGFEKKLVLNGVGYRAQAQGKVLNLNLGFSHPIAHDIPAGITVETPSQTEVTLKGADKQLVGQVAANIRAYRKPEPYKGKGIRYADEHVRRKEAKKK